MAFTGFAFVALGVGPWPKYGLLANCRSINSQELELHMGTSGGVLLLDQGGAFSQVRTLLKGTVPGVISQG